MRMRRPIVYRSVIKINTIYFFKMSNKAGFQGKALKSQTRSVIWNVRNYFYEEHIAKKPHLNIKQVVWQHCTCACAFKIQRSQSDSSIVVSTLEFGDRGPGFESSYQHFSFLIKIKIHYHSMIILTKFFQGFLSTVQRILG